MKLDAITIGALGFAGFATLAYLNRNKGATVPGGAGQVYNMLGNQRADVGASTWQNTAQLTSLTNWGKWVSDPYKYSLTSSASSLGVQA